MNWVLLEWTRLVLCFQQIFKEKLFLLCSLAVIASSMPKSLPFYPFSVLLLSEHELMFLGDLDRLREDIDLPVTHTLSYKPSTIFCASCGCCSHSGARYASKTICLDFEWVLLFLYGHSCLFCGLGYKGCSNVGCKINRC